MKRCTLFSLCLLLVFFSACDMKKQTRTTPPEKPKTVKAHETVGASSEESPPKQKVSHGASSWWEKIWSSSPKKNISTSPKSSWYVPFQSFSRKLNPASIVFTLTGGALVIHFLLKAWKK
ncbi:MAG: hypothetical protein N2314_02015 [Brevinematales bacterium]|nr:hypothetical protein [Brevinematales bacterium]